LMRLALQEPRSVYAYMGYGLYVGRKPVSCRETIILQACGGDFLPGFRSIGSEPGGTGGAQRVLTPRSCAQFVQELRTRVVSAAM
jgi:hypothetical protein